MFLAILFQIFLYFGIIALVAYWLFPLHDNIEKYFQNKVVWITGKSKQISSVESCWRKQVRTS